MTTSDQLVTISDQLSNGFINEHLRTASGSPDTTKEAARARAQGQDRARAGAQAPGLGILRLPLGLQHINMGPKMLIYKTIP